TSLWQKAVVRSRLRPTRWSAGAVEGVGVNSQLLGKTAVVTGASRGIGLAVVKALVGEGARVVGAARTITVELKEAAAGHEEGEVIPVAVDLSTPEGAERLIEQAR